MVAQLARPRAGATAKGLVIRGAVAHVKWSYYVAAGIHGYTVKRDKTTGAWSLTGTVVVSDAFKMRQRPLTFVVPTKQGNWEWEIQTLDIQQGTVRATLAPFQEWK